MGSRPVRYFDGVDDRIGLAAGALVAEPPLTVGVVCRRIGMPDGREYMLSLSEVGVDAYVTFGFTAPGDPASKFLLLNERWTDYPEVTLAATDLWAVVFASYDVDGNMRFSRKLLPGGTWVHGPGWNSAPETDSHAIDAVYLGCYHGVSNFFWGNVAAAAVWDRVLTDADRSAVSLDGSDGWLASNPVALWDLGQTAVDEGVVDLTANGADETELDGTSVAIEDVPWSLPSPPSAEKISVLTSAGWHELTGPPGPAGSPGPRGLKGDRGDVLWKADWGASEIYTRGDAVSFDGSSYVARAPATGAGQSPATMPSLWDLLAAEGDVGPTGPQGTPGTPVDPTPFEPWHVVGAAGEPAFATGWTNYGGAYGSLAFRKTPDGRVELRGLARWNTGAAPTVFTLPVGYRPSIDLVLNGAIATGTNPSQINVYVYATGVVWVSANLAAGQWVSLADVNFATDQAEYPTGPKGDKGDPGPQGTFLGVQEDHSVENVYSADFTVTGHTVRKDAAGAVLMRIGITPPVAAWWEITGFVGTFNKRDANYHYAALALIVDPAPEGWPAGANQQVSNDNLSQHATVQTFEPRWARRTVELKAGVAYLAYLAFYISGGTWRYSRSQGGLWIEGKAWAK